MAFNTNGYFFCEEIDYPKFLPFLPDNSPPFYRDFVSSVEVELQKAGEHVTFLKTKVSFSEFTAFCAASGEKPSKDAFKRFLFHSWGALPNA